MATNKNDIKLDNSSLDAGGNIDVIGGSKVSNTIGQLTEWVTRDKISNIFHNTSKAIPTFDVTPSLSFGYRTVLVFCFAIIIRLNFTGQYSFLKKIHDSVSFPNISNYWLNNILHEGVWIGFTLLFILIITFICYTCSYIITYTTLSIPYIFTIIAVICYVCLCISAIIAFAIPYVIIVIIVLFISMRTVTIDVSFIYDWIISFYNKDTFTKFGFAKKITGITILGVLVIFGIIGIITLFLGGVALAICMAAVVGLLWIIVIVLTPFLVTTVEIFYIFSRSSLRLILIIGFIWTICNLYVSIFQNQPKFALYALLTIFFNLVIPTFIDNVRNILPLNDDKK